MWGFTSKNKLKIALLLFTVLSLLLLTNLQERRMINRINENVVSIYEDRVVVGDYILSLSNKTQVIVKNLRDSLPEQRHKISTVLGEISELTSRYKKTYLTDNEKVHFDEFVQYCVQIEQFHLANNQNKALESSVNAENVLTKLSTIQVEEGKKMLDEVLDLTSTGSFLAYIEIVILIIIAALIQWIVLSAKPLVNKQTLDKHRMN